MPVSVFENNKGFEIRVAAVQEPTPEAQPARPEDHTPYPSDYRGLLLWLIQQAETPEAAPVVLQGAKSLMERVLSDLQSLHPSEIEFVVQGQRRRWWEVREADHPCETLAEKFQVLLRAGYVTRAFSDRAAHFDSLTASATNAAKNYTAFLREVIILLHVAPGRIP